jgi:polyisoprenoid-binding protein YceI
VLKGCPKKEAKKNKNDTYMGTTLAPIKRESDRTQKIKYMKTLSWILIFICITATAGDPFQEVKSHKITFRIKNAGITVDGSFSDLQADLNFDPKNLDKSALKASVGVASISTGIKKRDKDLQMRKYFDVEKYPRIKMTSTKIKHLEKNKYKGTFDLTIKGVTKQVEIPFTYIAKENEGTFLAEFTVNRRDYNVGNESWILSDEATVSIEVTIKKGKGSESITSRT